MLNWIHISHLHLMLLHPWFMYSTWSALVVQESLTDIRWYKFNSKLSNLGRVSKGLITHYCLRITLQKAPGFMPLICAWVFSMSGIIGSQRLIIIQIGSWRSLSHYVLLHFSDGNAVFAQILWGLVNRYCEDKSTMDVYILIFCALRLCDWLD